jgi:glutaredoxin
MLEIYVKEGCPYCAKQLSVLDRKELEYKLYDVDKDPEAKKRAREEYNANQVPVLVEDGEVKNIGFGGGG